MQLSWTTSWLIGAVIIMDDHAMSHQPMAVLESGSVNRQVKLTELGETGP